MSELLTDLYTIKVFILVLVFYPDKQQHDWIITSLSSLELPHWGWTVLHQNTTFKKGKQQKLFFFLLQKTLLIFNATISAQRKGHSSLRLLSCNFSLTFQLKLNLYIIYYNTSSLDSSQKSRA